MKGLLGSFKNVWKYLKKYWYLEVAALVLTIIATITHIKYSWLIKDLLDDVFVPKNLKPLLPISLLFVGLVLTTVAANLLKSYLFERVAQNVIVDIRSQLMSHVLRLPYKFFSNTKTGDIISRIVSDVENIQQMVSNALVELVTSFITVIGVLAWLLFIDWRLTIVTMAVTPVFIIISRKMGTRLNKTSRKIQEQRAEVTGVIQEAVSGIEVVKSFCAEDEINKSFLKKILTLGKLVISINVQKVFASTLWQSVLIPYQAVIFGIGGYWYISGGTPTIGTLFAYLNYMNIIIPATMTLINITMQISQAFASFKRIFEYLTLEPEQSGDKQIETGKPLGLSYTNISFSYDNPGYSLDAINFDIEPGEAIALVGPTGAGKTTIVKLLMRFYMPGSGQITVNGTNISEYSLKSLRKHIGMVSQDTFLFNASIKENLLYANSAASMDDIMDAAAKAQIHEHIMSLPDKYETLVGERGVKLSGGEKQRLSVARALLSKPDILIMDEPTSALDTLTENALWETMNKFFRGKTIIIIAHRLSTVRKADRIIVLDNGKIVESGKYDELIRNRGLFFKLDQVQLGTAEDNRFCS